MGVMYSAHARCTSIEFRNPLMPAVGGPCVVERNPERRVAVVAVHRRAVARRADAARTHRVCVGRRAEHEVVEEIDLGQDAKVVRDVDLRG